MKYLIGFAVVALVAWRILDAFQRKGGGAASDVGTSTGAIRPDKPGASSDI
jgi:hypothetical protein